MDKVARAAFLMEAKERRAFARAWAPVVRQLKAILKTPNVKWHTLGDKKKGK